MDTQTIQMLALRYLKRQRKILRKKDFYLGELSKRDAHMQRIDGDGDKDEFVLQGNLLMKLLRKFYAYNEMEKRHILSLNAAFEMYFVDDDVTDVAYVAKRLVLSVSIDRFVHYITGDKRKARNRDIVFALRQFGQQFNCDKTMVLLMTVYAMIKARLFDIEMANQKLKRRHTEMYEEIVNLAMCTDQP